MCCEDECIAPQAICDTQDASDVHRDAGTGDDGRVGANDGRPDGADHSERACSLPAKPCPKPGWVCNAVQGSCQKAYDGVNGVTPSAIVIGYSGAIKTGVSMEVGRSTAQGITAYFDHRNAIGGVYGRKMVLEARDDGYEPDRSESVARELLGPVDGSRAVLAMLAPMGTPTTMTTASTARPPPA